ncbi:MAG: hemolysin [Bacteroidetes bacterium MedPE-SWsnd-G2]|nr:MAG: hemolysin [Bacteroidetes bacterium MedPE-SWsnd-G2]
MEIAYVSSNKIHIEIQKQQGDLLSKLLAKLTAKPSRFIATMLIGNNISLVVYAFLMGEKLMRWFAEVLPSSNPIIQALLTDFSLLSQTIISTVIILITAEFLPKVFFQIYANKLLKVFSVPAYFFYVLFWPISTFVIWLSDTILSKVFKGQSEDVQLALTKVDLGHYISEQMESVENREEVDSEIQIFQNALEFSDVKARDVMVPRTEIIGINISESVSNLNKMFTDTGCSKIIVYKSTVDDVLGYVHSFDLFKNPKSIKSIMSPVELVPETMLVKDILNVLTKKRKSIAVVIDEYGGTSGIMTVEDIVEELFGEIEDEHDSVDLIEEQLEGNIFKFSARLEVDYINESYKLALPEDESYETLGGLIVSLTEEIPQKGDKIVVENYHFTILEASTSKIEVVSLMILED